MTKSRNRTLIRVTSSSEHREQKYFEWNLVYSLSIWLSTWWNVQNSQLKKTRWRRPSSWMSENVNNSGLNINVTFASNLVGRCNTAMLRWPRDQNSKPEVNSCHVIKLRTFNKFCAYLTYSRTSVVRTTRHSADRSRAYQSINQSINQSIRRGLEWPK